MSRARALLDAAVVGAAGLVLLRVGRLPEGFDDPETIFVSCAAYRDADCINTVRDVFDKADHPERVFVGVCEQTSQSLDEVCTPARFEFHNNVRRLQIPAGEAKGPVYARYLCSTLLRDEKYFCQVDSHTRFVRGWDTACVAMLAECPSKKPVLSHYPHDVDIRDSAEATTTVPVLCRSKFNGDGVPTLDAELMPAGEIRPIPYVSGGFVFAPSDAVREVPYDPGLDHLFQGEEILHAARLWTSGWDLFAPRVNVAFHHYGREESPKVWTDLGPEFRAAQSATMRTVRRLLGLARPPMPASYPYGMGTARSLSEYYRFAGIDPAAKTSASAARFCKRSG